MNRYIEGILNQSLSKTESSIQRSFHVEAEEGGFRFIPRFPTSLIMNSDLYYRIYDICAAAIYPQFTLIRAPSVQLIKNDETLETGRAFWYPWKQGTPKRLIGSIDQFSVRDGVIRLMEGIEYDYNEAVHTVITGNTGSGKSTALRYYLEEISKIGHVVLIDPKKSDGARWAKKHLKSRDIELIVPNANDRPEDFLPRVNATLSDAIQTLSKRQDDLFSLSTKNSTDYRELNLTPYFIVIDEVASLTIGLKKNLLLDFQTLLTQISLLGREAGIFLILSMQEARYDLLPVQVRSQMGVRILLGRVDRQTAQFLFPELETNFPLPLGGKGTGIISINDGHHFGIEPIAMPTIQEEHL